jgi:hypothetical protein
VANPATQSTTASEGGARAEQKTQAGEGSQKNQEAKTDIIRQEAVVPEAGGQGQVLLAEHLRPSSVQ